MTKKVGFTLLILAITAGFGVVLIPTAVSAPQSATVKIGAKSATDIHVATSTPVTRETLKPALVKVCTCESSQGTGKPQQFNIKTGKVLHGVQNNLDIGMCQINAYYHEADAKKLGMDIYTKDGNIAFANHLYATQGLAPWVWSKSCWGH